MLRYLKTKKRDVKFWVNIITIILLFGLVFISRKSISEAVHELGNVNAIFLALIIPVQGVSYYAIARLYKDYFKTQGDEVSLRTMYTVALELNFVNVVFPSGGVSGFGYLSYRLKKEGISAGKTSLANMLKYMLVFLAFICFLFLGVFMLALRQKTNPLVMLIASSVTLVTIFSIGVGVYIVNSKKRINAFVGWLPSAINKVSSLFRQKKKKQLIDMHRLEMALDELHQEFVLIRKNPLALKKPFLWALLFNAMELLTIYVVYLAFGSWINPGALIVAYAVANIAGLIAILPGGVGIYEGLMTAVLVSTGIDKGLALSATVVYRVLLMSLFLPIGFYFYRKNFARARNDTDNQIISKEVV